MIAQLFYILSLSLVNAHCGQLVELGKLKAINGERIKNSPSGWEAFGQSVARFALPLGDWRAPERYSGMNEKEAYEQMIKEGKSVRELFNEVVVNQKLVQKYDDPIDGFKHDTCGYFDPTFQVELDENTNPQSSTTGNNHHGPAEVWIDDVRTHHTSNLLSNQPEVVARSKYNCNKDFCQYRWYWIVFRADQKNEENGEAFQMWVNCAMIKGNGKNPISVKPNGVWVPTDTRHSYAKNSPGLPISPTPSETVGSSAHIAGSNSVPIQEASFSHTSPGSSSNGQIHTSAIQNLSSTETNNKDTLFNGAALEQGQSLISKNGMYRLIVKDDGNLVIMGPSGPSWSSNTTTQNPSPPYRATMENTGNFVLYNGKKQALYDSKSASLGPETHLVLRNNGKMFLFTGSKPRIPLKRLA